MARRDSLVGTEGVVGRKVCRKFFEGSRVVDAETDSSLLVGGDEP